jgi:SNF2 family DNA or RNA helicase
MNIAEISSIDEYLCKAGKMLANHVQERFKPLQEIGTGHERVTNDALRRPFPAQADAILATVKTLQRGPAAILVGEMGTGKSLMGAVAAYEHHKATRKKDYRAIVMAPSHLTRKWPREILLTIPKCRVFVIRSFTHVQEMAMNEDKTTQVIAEYSLEHLKNHPPKGLAYFCLSKEQAKLTYGWKPSAVMKPYLDWIETTEGKVAMKRPAYHCPKCDHLISGKNDEPVDVPKLKQRTKCTACDEPLWMADKEKIRRLAVSEFISKHMRGFFDLLVADEVHELKGGNTAQGISFGQLVEATSKTICLTGTLLGGYADDIFFILFRLFARKLRKEGFNYSDSTKWTARFGCLETITKEKEIEDNKNSKGKRRSTTTKRRPGISPLVFGKFLLEHCVFLELGDLANELPGYREEVISCLMDPDHAECYKITEDKLREEVDSQLARGNKQMLSTLLHTLLSYADGVYEQCPVFDGDGEPFMTPPVLPESHETQKEIALIENVEADVKAGRNCLVYLCYTHHRSVKDRLVKKLMKRGIKTTFMPSTVKAEAREDYINEKVADGCKVVICNPECVKTGLDLLAFPSIYFFQTGYNVYTLRQAARRSWRLGQKVDVKVTFLTYEKTIQSTALELIGKKLEASLALEGKFSEEGLMAMTSGEDMSTALAKALVSGLSDSEGVENVWKSINAKQAGSAINVDGDIYDVNRLLDIGWAKEQAEAFLAKFEDAEMRASHLDMIINAYKASGRCA